MNKEPMPQESTRILLVDDDEDDYLMIRDLLGEIAGRKFSLDWVSSFEAAKPRIAEKAHAVYLVDYRLGENTGLDVLRYAIAENTRAPLILLTGYGDSKVDLEAMKVGAADYLVKDELSSHLLERSIRYSIYRMQTIQTIVEREESFRSLLDSAFEGIVVHEDSGRILDLNSAAARILNNNTESLAGQDLYSFLTDESREEISRFCSAAEEQAPKEFSGVLRNSMDLDLELMGKPYQYRGRAVRLTAFRDITARRRLEAQVITQDRLASIGLLASSLAHEIGTPLGVIRGRAEYLGMQNSSNEAVTKNLGIIISQIDRVSKLIRSLLNLARGERSGQVRKISLTQAVHDVLDLMNQEIRRHEIKVINDLDANDTIEVSGESSPLQQVLINILVNSVHAIESEVKSGRKTDHFIRIGARPVANEIELSISDSGCGISKENMKNLFKPFFTTKDIGMGTGLGLATSYRIIESWGGRISVESQEGSGATFKLHLPSAQDIQ